MTRSQIGQNSDTEYRLQLLLKKNIYILAKGHAIRYINDHADDFSLERSIDKDYTMLYKYLFPIT